MYNSTWANLDSIIVSKFIRVLVGKFIRLIVRAKVKSNTLLPVNSLKVLLYTQINTIV